MRKPVLTAVLVIAALLLGGILAWTCGDKLLILGRGVRFQGDSGSQAASILLYSHVGSPAAAAVGDPKFQSALRDAGHKVQAVGSREELDRALRTGKYDIILADFADAPALEQSARAAPSKPVLVPAVYNGTKAEAAAAEKRYGCVFKMPGRTGHYLAVIDKAMELKSKRIKSKLVASWIELRQGEMDDEHNASYENSLCPRNLADISTRSFSAAARSGLAAGQGGGELFDHLWKLVLA